MTFNDNLTKFSNDIRNFIIIGVGYSIKSFIVKDDVASLFCTRGCKIKGR